MLLLILDREEGGSREKKRERERETSCEREKLINCASSTCPDQGSNAKPRDVP